jgi:hypothetical protein
MSKPIIESLLSRLGIKQRRLTGDAPYPCPVHERHTALLWPFVGGDMNLYFRCTNDNCRFTGGPVDLVSAARNIDIREALELFEPNGEFGDIFGGDHDQIILRTRARAVIEQAQLRNYVDGCRRRLKQVGQDILMPLQTKGVIQKYLLGTMCGMVDPNIPTFIKLRDEDFYAKHDTLLMPYYSGTEMTHLATLDPDSNTREIFPIFPGAHGVFMERELSWPTVESVLLCSTELDALRVMSGAATVTTTPINSIAVSDYEALLTLGDLSSVYLFSHPDAQLSLPDALRCWRTIANTGVELKVFSLTRSLLKVEASELLQYRKNSQQVWAWMADKLEELMAEGASALSDALTATSIDDVDREFLLEELRVRDASAELIETVECIRGAVTDKLINECVVRRDSSGYSIVSPVKTKLTNFSLHTSRFIQTPKGGVEAHCRLQVGGRMLPTEVCIPGKLLQNGSRRLKHQLWKLLGDAGAQLPEPLEAVNLPNFDWLDLLHKFDQANYYRGVTQLGVHDGRIDFPNFFVNTNTYAVEPQHNNLFVTDDVRYVYATMSQGTDDFDVYRGLLGSAHPSAAGIAGALGHIVHHFSGRILHGHEFRPRHFIYTSSSREGSMWETSFRQLCSLFSRSMMGIELLPGTAFKKQIAAYDALGDLPLFCRARGRNKHVENWLDGAEGPLIVLADPEASLSLGRLHNTAATLYDLQAFEKDDEPSRIDAPELNQMRSSWPALAAACLKRFRPNDRELESVVPARVGYTWLCELLDLKPKAKVLSMFDYYPPADWIDHVEVFFIAVNSILTDRSNTANLSTTQDTCRRHPDSIGWENDTGVFLMRKRIVDKVNEVVDHPISADVLEKLLVDGGIAVAERPSNRQIVLRFTHEEWDMRVRRRVRELRAETTVPVLKFA